MYLFWVKIPSKNILYVLLVMLLGFKIGMVDDYNQNDADGGGNVYSSVN